MTVENVQRVINLLATTEMPVRDIAERMGCSKSAVVAINRRFQVRRYNGMRTQWQPETASAPDENVNQVEDLARKEYGG